jgi:phage terminase large subunit-like protein
MLATVADADAALGQAVLMQEEREVGSAHWDDQTVEYVEYAEEKHDCWRCG